ncbi:MAG: polysaccharide deacetylase family protein [Pseudomonadota bacterium]
MADQPAVINGEAISDASLNEAYALIARTLGDNRIKATCAFVTAFAAGEEALRANGDTLRLLATHAPHWFSGILSAIDSGRPEGWFGPSFYRTLREDGHEMAWHGATHLSLADQTPHAAIQLELELAARLFQAMGATPRTIVFPRNVPGHLDTLRHAGFDTYRARLPAGLGTKVKGLLGEWKVWDGGMQPTPSLQDGWHVSPAGLFLNWPSGVRAFVPVDVTVRRWKSLLRTAVRQGGYVHMWFHPHNLITAPAMQVTFAEVMKEVGALIRSGDMVSLTMAEANDYYPAPVQGGTR